MEIAALIFDVFGTVVDWRTGVAREAEAAFSAKGVSIDAGAFADAWRNEYQPAMERIRSGARGYVALDDLHRENLERVLERLGHAGLFSDAEKAALNSAWEKLPPWPDSVPGIARLRRERIVAPCSNGSIALMTRLARFGGLPWDCILGADIAKDYKPRAEVYQASCAALRLPPEAVMMVAAHNDDLAAAQAAGLRTAFIARPLEKGPGGGGETEPTGDWDEAAENIEALAAMLGA